MQDVWSHEYTEQATHLRNDATTLRPLSGITGRKLSTSWQPLQGPSLLSQAYSDLNALNWTMQQPRRSVTAWNAFTIAYRTCERSFDMQFILVHNMTIGICSDSLAFYIIVSISTSIGLSVAIFSAKWPSYDIDRRFKGFIVWARNVKCCWNYQLLHQWLTWKGEVGRGFE